MNAKKIWIVSLLLIGFLSKSWATNLAGIVKDPLIISLSTEKTNCPNDPNGTAWVVATGGQAPYSYEWSNGRKTATITNLIAGGYFVIVTDAVGNKKNAHIQVEATNKLSLSFNQKSIACTNDTDGKVVAVPEGGQAPFSYLWANGSTKSSLEGIGAGMYMVTVTDANGCQTEEVIMLEAPEPLRIKAHYAHVSCGETSDGFMDVEASGGDGNYSFNWELDGLGGTHREGLKPGLYSVTVTDGNGCTNMICPEIIASQPPLLTYTSVPETCPGEADGKAFVSANGDSPPYRFEWPNNISTYNNAAHLLPGTYVVTVTNFRSCVNTIEVEVGQAGGGFGFVVETSGTACGTGANGHANVRITGGVAPFNYQWINEEGNNVINNNPLVTNLTAGNYEVMVTDANGCFGQRDVLIVEKPVPTVETMIINGIVCFGENTGSASATGTGGEGNLTYTWSNGQAGQLASDLGGGTYTVTATDANGCKATSSITIEESSRIIISEEISDLACNKMAGGMISTSAVGGVGGYTYIWSNGSTENSIKNILAGTYFLTVTDADGCQAIKGINIGQPDALDIEVTITDAADMNSSDGGASIITTGGTAPYTYQWSNGSTSDAIINVPAGTYTVTVTDVNGCQETKEIIIEAICTLMASITNARAVNCSGGNGAVTVTVFGAKGGVSFLWSNGATTSAIAGLGTGFYSVTVTDGNGCQYASGAFVGDGCICTQPVLEKVLVFEAHCGQSDGSIAIEMQGNADDFNYKWSSPNITGVSGSGLQAGTYQVTVTAKEDSQCSLVETINVSNTNVGPVIILQKEPEVCNVQKGSALLVPGDLDYIWSDGGTGSFRDNLSAGNYLVTVTNPNGGECQDILDVSIDIESSLTLSAQVNQYPNCGESNGSVTINVMGGSGNYNYNWGAATHNNLPKGTFDVLVTDKATGCEASLLFTLTENVAGVAIQIDTINHATCAGLADGKVDFQLITTGDFIGPAEVIITNGLGKEFSSNALPKGNYCLIAKDANGCYAGQSCFEIKGSDHLLVEVTVIPKTCNVENTILINSSGGNGLYTYNWADQDGEINPRDRKGIENGSYSVTVSDVNGCNIPVENIEINGECFICALEVSASISTAPECGLPNGAAIISVNNFFGNLSYSWGEDSSRIDLLAGLYEVTITDDYRGCDTTVSFTLMEPDLPSEATIAELKVCPNETGKLVYDLSNFRCFKQPLSVIITDEQGKTYNENALSSFGNYIFLVKDADGIELNRQEFSVESYEQIIANSALLNEGCTTLGSIDLELTNSEDNYTIQWEDLTGENQTVDRTNLSEGIYSVTITSNTEGSCSVTDLFNISKETGITADINPVALTCDLSPIQLNLMGIDIINYDWTPAVLVIDGQGTANPTVISDGPQSTIKVIATNSFGCTIEKEVQVKAIPTGPMSEISSSPQCDGLTINFSNGNLSSPYYIWDFGDGTTSDAINPSHTYEQAGDYMVQLRLKPEVPCAAEKGVIANQDLKLVAAAETNTAFTINYDPCQDEGLISFQDASSVNPGLITSWKWNFGNGMVATEQHPSIKLTEDATLNVTLEIQTDIGCSGTAITAQSFRVINFPVIPTALQICPGIPTELNPNNSAEGIEYNWTPAGLLDNPNAENPIATTFEPTNFEVKMTHRNCVRETSIQANVPAKQAYTLSDNEEVCDNTERLIYVEAPINSTIQWTDRETGILIGEDAEIMVIPGVYQVKLTDENGCPVTDEVTIENFAINAEIIDNTDPCEEGIGFLEIMNNNATEIIEIQWEDAEGIISADLNQAQIEVEPATTTDYSVMVKNAFDCEATFTETVQVSNLDNMVIVAERDTIFRGETTIIRVMPEGIYSVEWTPSNSLNDMSGIEQQAMPDETTTYTVIITDEATGCSVMREVTIVVKEVICNKPNIFVPNAFSPNGDGFNDYLFVRGTAITSVYFAVYNRWGELVFETNDQSIGWDGVFKSETVSSDVYAYYLQITCIAGETYETQGNVTVLN